MSPVHLPHHFQQGSYLWIAIYRPLLKVKHSNLQRSRAALRNTLRDWEMATLNESPVTLICRNTVPNTVPNTLEELFAYILIQSHVWHIHMCAHRERGVTLGYMYTMAMGQTRHAGDNCTNYCIIGREYSKL